MADKPPYPLHPFTMEDLELQMGSDENILKEHGLNKPLRFPDSSLNTIELDRQIDYLLYHHQEIPLSTLNRHAVMLLNCYIHGNKTPPPNLGLLFGQIMQIWRHQVKYAKKPQKIEQARQYQAEHPDATAIEIAKEVGVHRDTIYKWRNSGKLPSPS